MKENRRKVVSVKGLRSGFNTRYGYVPAVDDVSFELYEGESVALVGESGSGKSVTALSLMRLLDPINSEEKADELLLDGIDILSLSEKELCSVRGSKAAMIFQEPMTSLNPLHKVGDQITEALLLHTNMTKQQAKNRAIELIREVGIADEERRANCYPHEISGGMRQRIMIAMALSCNPQLLIADEPTTALDVTVQAQILDLVNKLQKERNMALLIITHNLGVVAEIADRVMIMYAGQIVESCEADILFEHPFHPYAHGLLKAVPTSDTADEDLYIIEGSVPSPLFYPKGCRFAPRCQYATDKCHKVAPILKEVLPGHLVRCWNPLSDRRGKLIW